MDRNNLTDPTVRSLRRANIPEGTFSHVEDHLFCYFLGRRIPLLIQYDKSTVNDSGITQLVQIKQVLGIYRLIYYNVSGSGLEQTIRSREGFIKDRMRNRLVSLDP